MLHTETRGGITLTMHLNDDKSVNLSKRMKVNFQIDEQEVSKEVFPDAPDGGIGTIGQQFTYADAIRKSEEINKRLGL